MIRPASLDAATAHRASEGGLLIEVAAAPPAQRRRPPRVQAVRHGAEAREPIAPSASADRLPLRTAWPLSADEQAAADVRADIKRYADDGCWDFEA